MAVVQFGSVVARGVRSVTHDPDAMTEGFWTVVVTFEGHVVAARMAQVHHTAVPPTPTGLWPALGDPWRSSLDRRDYLDGVAQIRSQIAAGTVYQVNLCRVLEHDLPGDARIADLGALLATGNPAPYSAVIDLPEVGLEVVCASPESFLVREGDRLTSGPIKGTAQSAAELGPKDHAENVMIVDLVRNDLAHVCRPGSVEVEALCRVEQHPGLVHLVSEVSGHLRTGTSWSEILGASFPPGSVSGAPKHTALQAIRALEPVPRGPYCGAVGWVDADRGRARLAVGIRTFWVDRDGAGRGVLKFGTGAGITWSSSAAHEWTETELKAARLIALATGGTTNLGCCGA